MKNILLALLLVSSPALASESGFTWHMGDQPAPAANNMQTSGDFGGLLFLTKDKSFFERWKNPEPPNLTPLEETVERNVPFYTVIIFTNPTSDEEGNVKVTGDITLLSPDGTVYGEAKDMEIMTGPNPAPADNLLLAPQYMGVKIEDEDPAGVYVCQVVLRDQVKNTSVTLRQEVRVEE